MRRKVATAIIMLALLAMAGVPAIANASSPDETKSDLSSLPEIEAYLGSIGVDMGSVVVQQGRLNYAGPDCPGAEWNCTDASVVVQITSSTLPAANVFDCLPALNAVIPALNECVIVQSSVFNPLETAATANIANCSSDFSGDGRGKGKCTVRQSSKKGNNYAEVRARITQRDSTSQPMASQDATQTAEIRQTSDSGSNTAKITQTIEQTLNICVPTDPSQKQEAHQTATVEQTSGSGKNWSDVWQSMLQVENAQSNQSITQEQNTDVSSARNQEASVTQTSTTGTNKSSLRHKITQRQDAETPPLCLTCDVTQTQGSTSGGQRGIVKQTTGNTVMESTADQNEDQTQDADTGGLLIQKHFGPQDCCAEQIGGTSANVNRIVQVSTQQDDPEGFSTSEQTGTCSETVLGAECTVDQTITQNGTPSSNSNSCTGPASCAFAHSCTEGECSSFIPEGPSLLSVMRQSTTLAAVTLGVLALREPTFGVAHSGGG